jgi:hypothetical protein
MKGQNAVAMSESDPHKQVENTASTNSPDRVGQSSNDIKQTLVLYSLTVVQ